MKTVDIAKNFKQIVIVRKKFLLDEFQLGISKKTLALDAISAFGSDDANG